jgi:tetratricopeptide (TPR) repeat protein
MIGSRYVVPMTLLLLSASTPAWADDAADEELAVRYYKLGEELYNRSDYEGALKQFQQSYALSKKSGLIFNMARCHESLGQHEKAIELYTEYLGSGPANSKTIEARIANLKRLLKKKQPDAATQPVVRKPDPPVDPPRPYTPPPPRPLRIPGWVLVGTGAAMLITGIVGGVMVLQKKKDAEKANTDGKDYAEAKSIEDSGRMWQKVEISMLVIGGVAAATGAVLLILDARAGKAPQERRAWLTPAVTPEGAMVAAGIRF